VTAEDRTRRTGYRVLFGQRELRLLFLSSGISDAGSWAYNVALLFYLYERTHSAAWVGAAGVVRMLAAFVTSPVAGVVADRWDRVRLMAASDTLCAGLQIGLVVTAAAHGSALLAVALSALTTAAASVTPPASAALLLQLVDEDHLVAANSLGEGINQLMVIVGPGLGALLLLAGPVTVAFGVNAASFVVSALLVRRISTRSGTTADTEGDVVGPVRQMLDGVAALARVGSALGLVAVSLLCSLIYGVDTVQLVIVSNQRLGTGSEGFGYLLAALGLGGLVAATFVNRMAASGRLTRLVVIGMAGFTLPTVGLLFTHQPAVAFGLEVVRGAGTIIVDVLSISLLQRSISSELLARVFGIFWSAVTLSIALGALVAPILIDGAGLTTSLVVMGTVPLALTLLATPVLLGNERRRAERTALLSRRADLLAGLALFEDASRPALESLAAACVEVTSAAGDVVVREGDPADALWILVDGEVEVSSIGEAGGAARPLRTMRGPTYFGEIGVLGAVPRTATVTAAGPCTLWRIGADDFRQAILVVPLGANFTATARARLRVTHPSFEPGF
jgi:MFS family permease